MLSEVENIKRGSVVATVEFDTGRRLIGVATANLMPGPNGIAPLSKQGAFQVQEQAETTETVDLVQALTNANTVEDAIAETVDLPMLDQQTTAQPLKEPVSSDIITENPVQVENPSAMTTFEVPQIEIPEVPQEETVPVAIDIQMPVIAETVVANEPSETNESLFEGAQVQETPAIETQMNESMLTNETQTTNVVPVAEENIMDTIPTTTPDVTIPTFNIDFPVISEPTAETPVQETVSVTDAAVETIPPVETITVEEVPTVQETVVEEVPAVQETVVEEVPVVQESVNEEVPVVQEPVNEEKTDELPQEEIAQEETESQNKDTKEELKEIIHQHRVIIQDCANAISRIAEELTKAAKSLEDLENKTMELVGNNKETVTKVEEIVQQGNTLVNEAFDRINAITTPRM